MLNALAREAVKSWKCGMLGHFARDCPKEPGAEVQRGAGLNVLDVQGTSQEHNSLIASLQNQVSLQHQLLAAQATLTQQDEMLGALGAPSHAGATMQQGAVVSMPLSPLTAPPAVAQAPIILGGAQPEGYVYISTNQGQAIWGHADIVQASMTDPA
jgi:hypothetical protein